MAPASPAFAQIASDHRRQIDAALAAYTNLEDCPNALRTAIGYTLLSGGKRLRPLLVLMAAEACGCPAEAAMPAACAVEMIHTYSLIHDDLPAIDDDDLRRGQPTCHKVYGEALAILAGDALLTLAFEVLAAGVEPPAVAARCCAVLAEAAGAKGMVGGQVDDLAAELENGVPDCRAGADAPRPTEPMLAEDRSDHGGGIERLESIHARKTGALIRISLRLGGLCAQASEEQLAALETYGRRLGLAFQILDDLLDVRGDEVTVGKRVGKDSGRGKLTFPGLLGIDESHRRAQRLIGEAIAALAPFGSRAAGLEALARYVLERNR
jgi:geranylgeranyl diphosphate synthase type II